MVFKNKRILELEQEIKKKQKIIEEISKKCKNNPENKNVINQLDTCKEKLEECKKNIKALQEQSNAQQEQQQQAQKELEEAQQKAQKELQEKLAAQQKAQNFEGKLAAKNAKINTTTSMLWV